MSKNNHFSHAASILVHFAAVRILCLTTTRHHQMLGFPDNFSKGKTTFFFFLLPYLYAVHSNLDPWEGFATNFQVEQVTKTQIYIFKWRFRCCRRNSSESTSTQTVSYNSNLLSSETARDKILSSGNSDFRLTVLLEMLFWIIRLSAKTIERDPAPIYKNEVKTNLS